MARRCVLPAVLVLMLCARFAGSPPAAAAQSREYKIKAAVIFNIARYAEWPAGTFADSSSPLRLCILRDNPFGAMLDELNTRSIAGRRLEVVVVPDEQHRPCAMLFLPAAEGALAQNMNVPRGMLIISEEHGGGVVDIFEEDNKLRLRVNMRLLKRTGVTLSSRLLRVAEVVEGP